MNSNLTLAIVLLPNAESLMPMLPAIAIMIVMTLALCFYRTFGTSTFDVMASFEKMSLGTKVALITGAQVLLLLAFAGKYATVVAQGQTVTLKIQRVDPVDFFRGNYMALGLNISSLDSKDVAFSGSKPFSKDQVVYVVLRKANPSWLPVSVHDERPPMKQDEVVLKGVITYTNEVIMRVHYGLEQYFFPEGKQPDLNRSLAVIKVDASGDAVLTALAPLGIRQRLWTK